MNRLLQHFVDSNGAPSASASRPPFPMPPQSSGGSYHGSNRGSYQRTAPGGSFYYQPPHAESSGANGLEEIPLTSQSSGDAYETVDLNTDTRQHQQFVTPTRRSSFQSPGSRESAAKLFSSGPPPVKKLVGREDNPYRSASKSVTNVSSGYGLGGTKTTSSLFHTESVGHFPSQMDPFATRSENAGTDNYTSIMTNPFATHKEENRNLFQKVTPRAEDNVKKSFTAQSPKETRDPCDEQRKQHSSSYTADPFASAYSNTSPNESPALVNHGHEHMPSADSLFGSAAPTNNGDWTHPAPFAQPSQPKSDFVQAQELFPIEKPSASSLFGAGTSTGPQTKSSHLPPKPPVRVSLSPAKPQVGILPSPIKSQTNLPPPPIKPSVGTPPSPVNNASSLPMRSQVASSASPVVMPEDHLTPAFGSMKLAIPAKPPLKSGLDVRHMKFLAGKHEDDAMSNAPSIAPSRMSMRSTLDDSLKLSDMYKQMTARLEGEKHDLLKVVAGQAQEIAYMKKHIKSLELQLKKYQAQDA